MALKWSHFDFKLTKMSNTNLIQWSDKYCKSTHKDLVHATVIVKSNSLTSVWINIMYLETKLNLDCVLKKNECWNEKIERKKSGVAKAI